MKNKLLPIGLALSLVNISHGAGFTPIALNTNSFNYDVVIEASCQSPINTAGNATMDGGTNKNGNLFYEVGYNPAAPATGLPVHGTTITATNVPAGAGHSYRFAPDYHVPNVLLVGHNNGSRTPVIPNGTLTLTTPAAFQSLSILATAGNGPVTVNYVIHYADSSTQVGNISVIDWFATTLAATNANAYTCAGRVSLNGGIQNANGPAAVRLYNFDIALNNSSVNVTSIDFSPVLFNVNGRAAILALSGSTDLATWSPLTVTGYNYDVVVAADEPQTSGTGLSGGTNLLNFVTATMDGGITKANNCWFEKGYYTNFPNIGIPQAGSTFTSAALPATYTMPASYSNNCAILLSQNVTNATINFTTPAAYGGLSFLCASANGDTFIPCVISYAGGATETNALFIPDWFDRNIPWAYHVWGRVNPNNNALNTTAPEFNSPWNFPVGYYDYRNGGQAGFALPQVRLYDAVIPLTNTATISSISLSFTNGATATNGPNSTRVCAILAVSGAPVGNVPPTFGVQGTPTPGQPLNAAVNNISLLKRYEGTNNIVLSCTNITGTGPITYQWKKAPRGGGLHDVQFSIDYPLFANLTDGGRVSGSGTSVLTISNALVADSGDYLVVASNPYGAVTSLVATVMLLSSNVSVLVGVPAGDTISTVSGEGSPAAESLDHVIDQVQQKWLSFGINNQAIPWAGVNGSTISYAVTPVSGASFITGIRFFTANDTQGRDPSDYLLEGSNDGGSTWSAIRGEALRGTLSLPIGRNGSGAAALDPLANFLTEVDFANPTSYKSYRVTITNVYDALTIGLMQINEIQLLGTFVPAPPTWVRQPLPDITVFVGASPILEAKATGLGSLAPKYQWYKNAGTLISGATSSAYTFPNAQLADSGTTFYCVASNSSSPITITSTTATLTVLPAPTQAYPVSVATDNALGYWRLNEHPDDGNGNSGVITHDYRGGHNGYYSNVTVNVPGYNPVADPDTAMSVGGAGNNSYVDGIFDVDFARAANAPGATFSVEAWVYGGNQGVDAGIVAKGYNGILTVGTGTGTEQFAIDVTGGNPRKFNFKVRDALGNGYVALSSVIPYDPILLTPVWHHVVGVCDQPNGKISIYVDGLLSGTGTITANAGILTQPLPMTIGARRSSGNTEFDQQWNGTVDDVAVYGSALSGSQVLAHYYAAQLAPTFSLQPVSVHTNDNTIARFLSSAYGPGTITYQWYNSDGNNPTTPIGGQTSSNYLFTATPAANNNFYELVATSAFGSVTSVVVQLTVETGPPGFAFLDLPAASTVTIGHVIKLQVVPSGTAPFTYAWQRNGSPLSDDYRTAGTHTDTLIIGYAAFSDTANYSVIVTGVGSTPSTTDALTVTNSLSGFFGAGGSVGEWSLNGTPSAAVLSTSGVTNTVQLTAGLGNTARSAWLNIKQNITSFTASFIYQMVSAVNGADGVSFCVQNSAVTAVGAGGGGLGVGGITPSVELELNIYSPNTRGTGFRTGGAVTPPFSPATPTIGIGDNNNPVKIDVNYDGTTFSAKFTDMVTGGTITSNYTVNIPSIVGANTAWVGFTGADGGVASTQTISWLPATAPRIPITFQKVGTNLVLTWPASAGAYLQLTPALTSPWANDNTHTFRVVGANATVTVPESGAGSFFRLQLFP